MDDDLKPGIPLVASSILVIGSCLFMTSLAISALAVTWDPCSMVGGAIVLPFFVVLGIDQYRGTFCRSRTAAGRAAILLFVPSGLMTFGFVTTVGEVIQKKAFIPWSLLAVLSAIAVGTFLAGWLNRRWSRQLPVLPAAGTSFRFSRREVAVAAIAIAVLVAITTCFVRTRGPRFAEHLDRDAVPFYVPPGASDISYCHGFRGCITYEFSIDEAGFRKWIDSDIRACNPDWAKSLIEPITRPVPVTRYKMGASGAVEYEVIQVSEGLGYFWYHEDQSIRAVFDAGANRAYYNRGTY